MTLEQVAYAAEIVGALAVVVSLVYLAVQVKHANAIARANAYRDFHHDIGTVLTPISVDPDIHGIWTKAMFTEHELESDEQDRLGMLLYQLFGALNSGYQSAWLDSSIGDYVEIMTDLQMEHAHIRGWWKTAARTSPNTIPNVRG